MGVEQSRTCITLQEIISDESISKKFQMHPSFIPEKFEASYN